jgi:hypothetical protein
VDVKIANGTNPCAHLHRLAGPWVTLSPLGLVQFIEVLGSRGFHEPERWLKKVLGEYLPGRGHWRVSVGMSPTRGLFAGGEVQQRVE